MMTLLLPSWYLTLLHNQLHIRTISTLVQPPQHMAWIMHSSLRDNSLESATEFLVICWTCISYLWCVAYCRLPLIVTTVTVLSHFIQVVIVLCTNWLAASEGSEHLWNENYVTNIIVHIHLMCRSKIMKRIYSVHHQARPSKVVVHLEYRHSWSLHTRVLNAKLMRNKARSYVYQDATQRQQ